MGRNTYTAPATWDALRMDYLNGHGTIRGLADKHGVNPGTAEQRAKRERWTAQRSEYLAKKRELLASPAPMLLPALFCATGEAASLDQHADKLASLIDPRDFFGQAD